MKRNRIKHMLLLLNNTNNNIQPASQHGLCCAVLCCAAKKAITSHHRSCDKYIPMGTENQRLKSDKYIIYTTKTRINLSDCSLSHCSDKLEKRKSRTQSRVDTQEHDVHTSNSTVDRRPSTNQSTPPHDIQCATGSTPLSSDTTTILGKKERERLQIFFLFESEIEKETKRLAVSIYIYLYLYIYICVCVYVQHPTLSIIQ